MDVKQLRLCSLTVSGLLLTSLAHCLDAQTTDVPAVNPLISLMESLSKHTKTPAQVLDPEADPNSRSKALSRLDYPQYQLSLVPTESVSAPTGDTASIPVRVHFKTSTEELDAEGTAKFVRRGGTWFFSDFEFLSVPPFLTFVIIACCTVGVVYAVCVLILRGRLVKHGQLNWANLGRLFIPFCWPSLLRETGTKQ